MNNTREKCDCHCNWHGVFVCHHHANGPFSLLACITNSPASFHIQSIWFFYTLVCSFVLIAAKMKGKEQQQTPSFNIGAYHAYIALLICFLITFFMINIRNSTRQPFCVFGNFLCDQNTASSQRWPTPRSTSNTNPRRPVLFSVLTSEKNVAQQILGPILVSTEINLCSK